MEVSYLYKEFMRQFNTESGRIIDDNQWSQFVATLTPDQKQSLILAHEMPISHDQDQA